MNAAPKTILLLSHLSLVLQVLPLEADLAPADPRIPCGHHPERK